MNLHDQPDCPDLRFEMRVVAKEAYGLRDNFFGERSDEIVDAILAMPEMQAIRAYLRAEHDSWCCHECWVQNQASSLPECVREWVLS